MSERIELAFLILQVSVSATWQLVEALIIASGGMTPSVSKPSVIHCMSPESLIEKAILNELKWVLLIANFGKLHLPGLCCI